MNYTQQELYSMLLNAVPKPGASIPWPGTAMGAWNVEMLYRPEWLSVDPSKLFIDPRRMIPPLPPVNPPKPSYPLDTLPLSVMLQQYIKHLQAQLDGMKDSGSEPKMETQQSEASRLQRQLFGYNGPGCGD